MNILSDNYAVNATKKTPSILFDKNKGQLKIEGRSLPEDSMAFYGGIFSEVDDYLNHPQELTNLIFNMEYFNSISSKTVLMLILKFEKLLTDGKHVDVTWHYDDEDDMMYEVGEVFKATTKISFRLLKTVQ